MPRRMIDSRIFSNEKYGDLPLGARQLMQSILTHADEDGRLKGSSKFLRSISFPYDEDIATSQTEQWRDLLATAGFIRTYSKDGDQFLDIPGWTDPKSEFHQVLRKDRYTPSVLPCFHEADNQLAADRQPDDNHLTDSCHPQGKVSKDKIAKTPPTPPTPKNGVQKEKPPYQNLVAKYHEICSTLPPVEKLSDTRREILGTRWREHPHWEFWEDFWKRVMRSSFLRGETSDRGWKASLFWCLKEDNFLKILEGHYDDRDGSERRAGAQAHQRAPPGKRDYDGKRQVDEFRAEH